MKYLIILLILTSCTPKNNKTTWIKADAPISEVYISTSKRTYSKVTNAKGGSYCKETGYNDAVSVPCEFFEGLK